MPIGFETSEHHYLKRSVKVALIFLNEPHRLISARLVKTQLTQKASFINQDVTRKPKDGRLNPVSIQTEVEFRENGIVVFGIEASTSKSGHLQRCRIKCRIVLGRWIICFEIYCSYHFSYFNVAYDFCIVCSQMSLVNIICWVVN